MKTTNRMNKIEKRFHQKTDTLAPDLVVTLTEKNGKRYRLDGTEWIDPEDGVNRLLIITNHLLDV